MKYRYPLPGAGMLLAAVLMAFPSLACAAGQTSATYRVVADVFCSGASALAVGSARYQTSLSVGQSSLAANQYGSEHGAVVEAGYQATTEGFDSDYDGIPDSIDPDDDNDGIPDALDPRPYDTDDDGLNNVSADSDDDGDGLDDMTESAIGTSRVKKDTDGDTQDDYVEHVITGTDPLIGTDYLRFIQVSRSGTNTVITWASVPGKTNYWIQRSQALTNPASWSTIMGPFTAGDYSTSVTDSHAPVTGSCYRVRIPY